MLSASAEGRYC